MNTARKLDLYTNLEENKPKHLRALRFIDEFAKDLNGTRSAIRAGYAPSSAKVQAAQLLTNPNIICFVNKKLDEIAKRNALTQDWIIQRLMNIVSFDVGELSQYRRNCCRYCHSENGLYQYTYAEMHEARKKHNDSNRWLLAAGLPENQLPDFDEMGGDDFDRSNKPNLECKECRGEGEGRAFFADTTNISPQARAAFLGVKTNSRGEAVAFEFADSVRALEILCRILRLY